MLEGGVMLFIWTGQLSLISLQLSKLVNLRITEESEREREREREKERERKHILVYLALSLSLWAYALKHSFSKCVPDRVEINFRLDIVGSLQVVTYQTSFKHLQSIYMYILPQTISWSLCFYYRCRQKEWRESQTAGWEDELGNESGWLWESSISTVHIFPFLYQHKVSLITILTQCMWWFGYYSRALSIGWNMAFSAAIRKITYLHVFNCCWQLSYLINWC